jgi:hypothetical protein
VFAPLDMTDTTFGVPEQHRERTGPAGPALNDRPPIGRRMGAGSAGMPARCTR